MGLGILTLLNAGACADEMGGDGWVPPRAMTDNGGEPASGGMLGGSEGGGGGEGPMTAGKSGGGKGGKGGSGGKAGTGGTTGEGGEGIAGMPDPGGSVCGNGVTEPPLEDCDDGNTVGSDACPANCRLACETCEKTYCKAVRSAEAGKHGWALEAQQTPADLYTNCMNMPGLALGGPAQGVERSELCRNVVDCVRREQCEQFVPDDLNESQTQTTFAFLRCYCDLDVTASDYVSQCTGPGYVPGKCARELQEASELETKAVFGIHFGANGHAFGASNVLLLQCDKKLCLEECYPEHSSGPVAEIGTDIVWQTNAAGESPLGNLIVDAHRAATGTDFGLMFFALGETGFLGDFGSGGLWYDATPGRAADANGRVLESELGHVIFGMNPRPPRVHQYAGNKLVTTQVTGLVLYNILSAFFDQVHVSGLAYTWDASLVANRVTEIRKNGTPIDSASTYALTTNNVAAATIVEAGILEPAAFTETDKNPLEETKKYLKSLPQPVMPPPLDRVIRLN
jgi:cysteine-rich repeat protein